MTSLALNNRALIQIFQLLWRGKTSSGPVSQLNKYGNCTVSYDYMQPKLATTIYYLHSAFYFLDTKINISTFSKYDVILQECKKKQAKKEMACFLLKIHSENFTKSE